jgi:hypothetical protein
MKRLIQNLDSINAPLSLTLSLTIILTHLNCANIAYSDHALSNLGYIK